MRYLAIDFGEKRTGLAIGDGRTKIVTPLEVIMTSSRLELLRHIERAVKDYAPDAIVLGLALNMDGSEGKMAKSTRQFATALSTLVGLTVYLFDERLTSFDAEKRLLEVKLTRRKKKQRLDAMAAAVLLEDFLKTI